MDVKFTKLMNGLPQSVFNRPGEAGHQLRVDHQNTDGRPVQPTPQKGYDELRTLVDKLNQHLANSSLRFEVDQSLQTPVIKVIDETENRVIRQIPSQEAMARMKAIDQFLQENHSYDRAGQYEEAITGILLNRHS